VSTTVTNVGGSPVELAGASIDGSGDFAVTTVLPVTLAPGEVAQIETRFAPEEEGSATAVLSIAQTVSEAHSTSSQMETSSIPSRSIRQASA
jgi:hypothetical protein